MTPGPVGQGWANRLVAMWCDKRAVSKDVALVKRCRRTYRVGPLVGPVNRFADLLEKQAERNAAEWRALAKLMREQADEMNIASIPPGPIQSIDA